MAQDQAREKLLLDEITRLQGELKVLERQWGRKHWLGLTALIAIPLLAFGLPPVYALIAIVQAPCLVATQAYLLWVRRNECRELIGQARRDLVTVRDRLSAPPA